MKSITSILLIIIIFIISINFFLLSKLNFYLNKNERQEKEILELENELGTLKFNYDDLEKDYQLKIYRILQDKGCEKIDYE